MVPRSPRPRVPLVLPIALATTVVGALAIAAPASAVRAPADGGAPRYSLTLKTPKSQSKAVRRLHGILPHASVGEVLGSANRNARPLPAGNPSRGAKGFQNGFQFNAEDTATTKFYPQGITGSADASPTGLVDGRKALLVSWYAKNPVKDATPGTVPPGVRVSFVTAEKLTAATYRHVLLVDPYTRKDKTADFRSTASHAGGIAWVGARLYVAETTGGLSVYDTSRMWKVSATSGNKSKVGCTPNPCEAADYQYVMPKVASYEAAGGLHFSSVSYDRSTNSLMTGEYYDGSPTTKKDGTPDARLARWPLATDGSLAGGKVTTPSGLWTTTATNVQGAMTVGGTLYLSTSGGNHSLYTGPLGGTLEGRGWPTGAEDLSFAAGSNRIYSLTESPGNRSVFAVGR